MEKCCPLDLSPDEIVAFTPEWDGERFPDGRPRVADELLARMKAVTVTQAWSVLHGAGFTHQYEGGWVCTHPGQVLVGRAFTVQYMPRRPDAHGVVAVNAERLGRVGEHNSWSIDMLGANDVYVADVFGKIDSGSLVGDNLATSIYTKTGVGIVHDGAVRDLDGVQELSGFTSFVRGFHPTHGVFETMLMGVNGPIRIGAATVMPGDVVLGRQDGVVFIPPHLADQVVKTSEVVQLRDIFGKACLRDGKYTPGQIDTRWTDAIEQDFSVWLEDHIEELPVPREAIQELLKTRTW